MPNLARGLYETLVTASLSGELARLPGALAAERAPLAAPEAADRLALHLGSFLRATLAGIPDRPAPKSGTRVYVSPGSLARGSEMPAWIPRRSAAEPGDPGRTASGAGGLYPSELCGRTWL